MGDIQDAVNGTTPRKKKAVTDPNLATPQKAPESIQYPQAGYVDQAADIFKQSTAAPVEEEKVPEQAVGRDPAGLGEPLGKNPAPKGSSYLDAIKEAGSNFVEGVEWAGNSVKEGFRDYVKPVLDGPVNDVFQGIGDGLGSIKDKLDENPNFLIGATPVLMGLLTGNTEEGAEFGSRGLLSEYDTATKRVTDAQKAKTTSSNANRYKYVKVEDKDGIVRYYRVDEKTLREPERLDLAAGYSPKLTKDPRTEEIVRSTGTGKTSALVNSRAVDSKFNVYQKKQLRGIREKMVADKDFEKARTGLGAADTILNLLSLNSPISDQGIKTLLPRMFGEVGNLAAAEQERFSGSPAILAQWNKLKQKYDEGTLDETNRDDLLNLTRVMQETSRDKLRVIGSKYSSSFEGGESFSADDVLSPFLTHKAISAKKAATRAQKRDPRYGKDKYSANTDAKGNTHYFKIDTRGEYTGYEYSTDKSGKRYKEK